MNNLMHIDDIARLRAEMVFILPKWIAPAPNISWIVSELYSLMVSNNLDVYSAVTVAKHSYNRSWLQITFK